MMKKKINFSRFSKPIILVAFIIILTVLRPTTFPTVSNIANVLWSVSVIGIMACGAIFVFLLGVIDLYGHPGDELLRRQRGSRHSSGHGNRMRRGSAAWIFNHHLPDTCVSGNFCHLHGVSGIIDADYQ